MLEKTVKKQDKRVQEFENLCREKGLKITPQRIAVFKALITTKTHPTAEEVYREVRKELNNISLDTVNRTLNTLLEIGAAFLVEGTGQPKRYDGGGEDHHHFRCLECGQILDFHYEPFEQIELPPQINEQFTVLRKSIYLEGICKRCLEQKEHCKEGRCQLCQ